MKADSEQQKSIMHYLLGQTRPEDASSMEERLVTDSEFYVEVLIAEDELIDQYVRGELSESERDSFEEHFLLTPERQRKVRFGRALSKYVSAADPLPEEDSNREEVADLPRDVPEPPPKRGVFSFLPFSNPIISYALAAVLLLIVGGVSWAIFNKWRQQTPDQSGNVYVATLTPGLTRDGGGNIPKIKLSPAIHTVELRLELLKSEYRIYRSVVLADDLSQVWASDDLIAVQDAGASFVVSRVPAKLLAAGDYRIKLRGRASDGSLEDVASSYPFRVIR